MLSRYRNIIIATLIPLGFYATNAHAGGCLPTPSGAAALPPCCASTDMSAGGRCTASAAQFSFTLVSFGFEKSDGTEVSFGSPRRFDAAAVSAGGALGDYLAGIDLPAATYVALRPTLGESITIRADTRTADGRRCTGGLTAPARQADGSDYPMCAAGEPNASTSICRNEGLLRIRDNKIGNFTIGTNSSLTLNFQLDVNNGVICSFPPGSGNNNGLELGVLSVNFSKS